MVNNNLFKNFPKDTNSGTKFVIVKQTEINIFFVGREIIDETTSS